MSEALLTVHGLHKSFGGVRAVDGVDFTLHPAKRYALIGPNGAGKTTCFNLLTGQLIADSGDIAIEGQRISGRRPQDMASYGIARTFQVAATFSTMTVKENVQVALLAQNCYSPWGNLPQLALAATEALLHRVGIDHLAHAYCHELAYADLKRVELAQALARQPRILLLDEPTAGMASGERKQLMELINTLTGVTVLFIEHDMDTVFAYADWIFVLHQGRLLASGTPAEIRHDPRVKEVYLG